MRYQSELILSMVPLRRDLTSEVFMMSSGWNHFNKNFPSMLK